MLGLTPEKAKAIGAAAYKKVLAAHTYAHRADQLETLLYTKITKRAEELV